MTRKHRYEDGERKEAYDINYTTSTDRVTSVLSSTAGNTSVGWDSRGNRASEDNDNSAVDRRDYTYDGRSRVRTVLGKVLSGILSFHDYRITYAYDHRDRLVFRSFFNITTGVESQYYYYWDLNDRLIEVKQVPNIANSSTYTIYDFYWLLERPVATWATAFPAATTARYFMHTDEANRVVEVYDWPSSGDATLNWAVNPEAFGWDIVVSGSIYQPFRLNDALLAETTASYKDHGFGSPTLNRPALLIDRGVVFDPMTESTLQRVGLWPSEPYGSAIHSPSLGWRKPMERMEYGQRRACSASSLDWLVSASEVQFQEPVAHAGGGDCSWCQAQGFSVSCIASQGGLLQGMIDCKVTCFCQVIDSSGNCREQRCFCEGRFGWCFALPMYWLQLLNF